MPASKPIRRAQLITPFGVGAMVDFPRDESLMVAGLDAWPFAKETCPPEWLVFEERLQERLGVHSFRLPPEHKDPAPGVKNCGLDVPTVRFPRWHYCHRCGGMDYLPLFGGRQRCLGRRYAGMNCSAIRERSRPFLIPVRLVAVCEQGHIEDFPFMEWVHRDTRPLAECKLRFLAGRSSAMLSGIKVECSCGEARTLAGIFDSDNEGRGALQRIGYHCRASQPWLGHSGAAEEQCGLPLRVIQRGASNAYFPLVVSSIYLPLWAEKAQRAVIDELERPEIWRILTSGLVEGNKIDPVRCETIAQLHGLNAGDLLDAAQQRLDGAEVARQLDEEEYRRQEYTSLLAPRGGPETELFVKRFDTDAIGPELGRYFRCIGLVYKLRETRALAGFTRLLPPDRDNPRHRVQPLFLDPRIDWLPATVVRGEGIFLELRRDVVECWLRDSGSSNRVESMAANYNTLRRRRGQSERRVTPPFVLLHSLAHSLMNQLSFDCGYGSASLRERIYSSLNDNNDPMLGILIYTASGDAEGTMGGLVRQGEPERLLRTLISALRKARWCSSDPVCIEARAQGTDNANLAACHGCLLVSETSCEEGNRLLDRALLIGATNDRRLGFFSNMV